MAAKKQAPVPVEPPKRRGRGRPKIGERFTFAMEDDLYFGIKAYAEANGLSLAEAVRLAISDLLGLQR